MEDRAEDDGERLEEEEPDMSKEDSYSEENAVVESFMSSLEEDKTKSEEDDEQRKKTDEENGGELRDIDDSEGEEGTKGSGYVKDESGDEDSSFGNAEAADSDRVEGRRVIAKFLHSCTCYDITPESSKVLVFDRSIPIRLSYYALVEHEIGAAPLWDPLTQRLSGIITTLDFIELLRYGHTTNSVQEILDNHSVASWRSLVTQLCQSPALAESLAGAGMPAIQAATLAAEEERKKKRSIYCEPDRASLSISPDASLYEACRALKENGMHWLPIVDESVQLCLGVITHLAVLQYLVTHFVEDRRLFEQPIRTLGIGTFASKSNKLVTATLDTKVHKILDLLSLNRISCVPILNSEGKPIAVYARTNVIDLVSHNSIENSLDLSLGNLIFGGAEEVDEAAFVDEMPDRMRLHTCSVNDTLQQVFIKFAQVRVHRLLYVDDEGFLKGIVSLSDLLSYFLE